jgi:tetratricopeptide (TPR) repeat protein
MIRFASSKRQQIVRQAFIALALVIATVVVYLPVRHNEFVEFDDNKFVTENPNIRDGLTWRSIRWTLTAGLTQDERNADYWRPLSFLSHALDIELFELRPAGHHLMNVGIHAAAAVALFLVLQSMTNAFWRCALVAALFALHPLRVESVAWVTERKDVLSGLFFMLTLGAYVGYVRHPFSWARYLAVALLFALGLMSKSMVATLPFVLLLLDYWPLGRTRWAEPVVGGKVTAPLSRLLVEKLPLFALAAASGLVTLRGRAGAEPDAISFLAKMPLAMRIGNALLSYGCYIGKVFWPIRLAVFYPLYPGLSTAVVIGAGVALAGVTAAVIWGARRGPWLVTGWFWYLGMLVPVIGLLQRGGESMADRFTYLPSIGLLIMLCWSVPARALERRIWKATAGVVAAVVVAVCAALSMVQVGYWKDTETLFRHALDVTRDNWLAHYNLGVALSQAGRFEEAIGHYEQTLRLTPDDAAAHNNLGACLSGQGKVPEAIAHFERALRIKPDYAEAHCNLANVLQQTGKFEEAIAHYEQALQSKPDYAEAHCALGIALEHAGRVQDAVGHYEQALRLKPDYAEAHYNLGVASARLGRLPEAVGHWEQALRSKPDYAEAHYNLGVVLGRLGRLTEAVGHWEQALRSKPDYAEAHCALGIALEHAGRVQDAIGHYEQALRLKPDDAEAQYNLGVALVRLGRRPEAMGHWEQALRSKPDYAEAENSLAWLLATIATADGGDPVRAVTLSERACKLTDNRVAGYLDTLAVAYAAVSRFQDAVATARKAIELARSAGQLQVVSEFETRLELYRAGRAYRAPASVTSPHAP